MRARLTPLRHSLLITCSALLAGLSLQPLDAPAQPQAGGNMKDQLIVHFCSRAIRSDFKKAGQTPPEGMVASTCACVVQKIKGRASIEQAKTLCKAEAQQKYSLPERP